ncbi:hypothetical protein FRC09_010726 [Ceratobasidium sp. 395]|nr:hypothetical protein FRC09_010726 [Ceratobasidium sp. 395]
MAHEAHSRNDHCLYAYFTRAIIHSWIPDRVLRQLVNTAENDLMDITRSFWHMAVDSSQSEDKDAGPFSLPLELSGPAPNQTSSPHGELAPPPALATPLHRSHCQAAAQPNPSSINVSSAVNATLTSHSVSKANLNITTTVTSAPPAAAQTPAHKSAEETMSPGLLWQLQAIQSRNLSSEKLAQLLVLIHAALDMVKNLDMSNIPIDANAIFLAALPVKNGGSVPPPYKANDNEDDSELSNAPQGVRTFKSSSEDMEIDDCFGAVAAPRIRKKSSLMWGGNKGGGHGVAKKDAAGGSKKKVNQAASSSGCATCSQGVLGGNAVDPEGPPQCATRSAATQHALTNLQSVSAPTRQKRAPPKAKASKN